LLLAVSKKAEDDAENALKGANCTAKHSKKQKKQQQPKEHEHVTAFKDYIRKLNKFLEEERKKAAEKDVPKKHGNRKASKIGVQPGRHVQEGLLYDPACADKHKCPKCNHNLVMKAETPAEEAEYKQALAENKAALAEYEQLSAAKKRSVKRPTLPKKWKHGLTLVCM